MAKNNVIEQGKSGNRPVTNELRRAGARMGYTPAVEEPEPEAALDRTDEEFDHLRAIVKEAEAIFFHEGSLHREDPSHTLIEALNAAADDFATISMAEQAGAGVESSAYRRAELRCKLAVALFEYRRTFPFADDASETESEVVS